MSIKLLEEIAARPRHRGALFLDIEDMLEIDAALAAEKSQEPSDLVTRESAEQAIDHVTQHNGGGRDEDARNMLVSATQPQAPRVAVTGWQPIETAPKDGSAALLGYGESAGEIHGPSGSVGIEVMTYSPGGDYPGYDWGIAGDAYGNWFKPTHWMHLPAAPETPEWQK